MIPITVLAINGSPNKDRGNTALVLNPFLEGMTDTGADVSLYYTEDLAITRCKGDLACMIRTPGRCIHRDDMDWLLPQITGANILVMASPVYYWGLTGPMKTLMDRMYAGASSPSAGSVSSRHVVLVSNCGQWDLEIFDPLLAQMNAWCRHADLAFTALLRPHGPALKGMLEKGLPVGDVQDAAREAGRQLIREGAISRDLLAAISRPLLPRDKYMQILQEGITDLLKANQEETKP